MGALLRAVENVEDDVDAGRVRRRVRAAGRRRHRPHRLGPHARTSAGHSPGSREIGATTALVTSNPDAELAPYADHLLAVATGPEVLTGSTRLKAGTAQKLVLNSFSTAVMIRLGRTWSNLMVDVVATNAKLRGRVVRILREASGAGEDEARLALERADGELKPALLSMLAGIDADTARTALAAHQGSVARALASLTATPPSPSPSPSPKEPPHDPPRRSACSPPPRPSAWPSPSRPARRPATPAAAVDGDSTTLTVWSWRVEDEAAYTKIFDAYEKAHEGVTVDFKAFKATEYNKILATGLAGSDGPDVPQVRSYGQLQTTVASKSLVPLDGKVDLAGWDENVVASAKGKEDGKIYSVPFARQTMQMFYNQGLFEKNGLEGADHLGRVHGRQRPSSPAPASRRSPWGPRTTGPCPIVHEVLAAPRFGGKAFQDEVTSGSADFTDPDWVASVKLVKEPGDVHAQERHRRRGDRRADPLHAPRRPR